MLNSLYKSIQRAGSCFLFLMLSGSLFAQQNLTNLLLSVKHSDYDKVKQAIQKVNGQVKIEHKYADVMAVSIPADQVSKIISLPEVKFSEKDQIVSLPKPPRLAKESYNQINGYYSMNSDNVAGQSIDDLKKTMEVMPENYYPFTNNLTNTLNFYKQTGHFGENVVVAVIDAGISRAANAVSGRIIGGDDFSGDGLNDPTSPSNGSHGTWVACCIGANAVFGFANPAIQNAIKNYAPNSVIPDYFAVGIDGIPMIGEAPGALFYSLKVFPYNQNSTLRSIIAQAMERAIELKELYNSGQGGVNIRIVNMSLGGTSLFAGQDPFYAPLVERAIKDGILIVVSAGNEGPSGMTISTPGDSKGIITAGATNDAVHERIIADLQYGPNVGYLYRPLNDNQIAYFSSRGPIADGRPDPDITAPGWYRFAQNPNGTSVSWVSGTSFSSPTTAGAAALLISARPQSTPADLRGALLNGANRNLISGRPDRQDQGFGFLDVYNAYKKLSAGVFNPPDLGIASPLVAANIQLEDNIRIIKSNSYSASTGWLNPGERADFNYYIPNQATRVTINVSNITQQLPADQQNQLFGDDIFFSIHSAQTSNADYLGGTPAFVGSNKTYILEGQDLDRGIARITVLGDWTNAGKVSANISITTDLDLQGRPFASSTLTQGQVKGYNINVAPGTAKLDTRLQWENGWDILPVNDLDLVLYDPNGNVVLVDNNGDGIPDGSTLSMPELISIANPSAGIWTAAVAGYTIWETKEKFQLYADRTMLGGLAKPLASAVNQAIPTEYQLNQNNPNPFNPTTVISYAIVNDSYTTLKVYNSLGRLVRTLVNEVKPAGYHQAVFDGRDEMGAQLSSGMYIYQLTTDKFVKSGKMIMLK